MTADRRAPRATRAIGRRSACLFAFSLVWMVSATRSQSPPSTDIFLLTVVQRDERVTLSELVRVTDRDGYDNQPAFLPDGSIVFSSLGEAGHTEILRFDPATGRTSVVVSTPQSEYSPTPVPGQSAISVVRDYGGGDQQLWRFPVESNRAGDDPPALLLPDVNPVGYHAWIDADRVLLFVLGEPATLQVAKVGAGPGRVVAENPGRGLARVPAASASSPLEMSFVRKVADDEWWLEALDAESGTTRRLVRAPAGREDYAWSPDGSLWMSDGSRLLRWRPGAATWSEIADLAVHGLRGITRLAFDASGGRLALVAEH